MGTTEARSDPRDVTPPCALLINGTVGVGKTTVAEAVSDLLVHNRVPNAVIDVDALRQAWPCPPEDRFSMWLALRNLTSVTATHVEMGTTRLILAGVIETPSERRAYESALGMPLTICRLHGDLAVIRDRLIRRHGDDVAALQWHLDRAPELDAILDCAAVDDCRVDATTGTPQEIALAVSRAVGWAL